MAGVIEQSQISSSGSPTATSEALTFSVTPDSGTTLYTSLAIDKSSGGVTVPTGFTLHEEIDGASVSLAIATKVSDGTEGTVTWNWTTARAHSMYLAEVSGLDTSSPYDVSAQADSGATSVTSQTSGTTASTAQALNFALGSWASDTGSNTSTGRAYTNSFAEDAFTAGSGGSPGHYIGTVDITSIQTVESTYSTTGSGDQMAGTMIALKEPVVGGDEVAPPIGSLAQLGVGL